MPISKIRPRGDIKTNWETVNPILQLREIGVEWESTIGEGDAKIKFGDGLTHWNDLDYAIVNNITKKIVTALAVVEEEDPELNDGEAVDTLFGKIKKKFQTIQSKIAAINTIIGVFEDITIDTGGDSEQAAENITTAINLLNTGKLTTSDIYNGLDSTNTALALSALQGKNLNDAITSLNSDLQWGQYQGENCLVFYNNIVGSVIYISSQNQNLTGGNVNSNVIGKLPSNIGVIGFQAAACVLTASWVPLGFPANISITEYKGGDITVRIPAGENTQSSIIVGYYFIPASRINKT